MVKRSHRIWLYVAGLVVSTTGYGPPVAAQAATATATIAVSATVLSNCTIAATALAFGNYTQVVNNNTATLTVTCTSGTTYTIALDNGTTGTAPATRKMTMGANTLTYALYSDTNRTVVWGSSSGTVAGTGNGAAQPLTVFGQIPAGQFSAPGSYTDTVTATLTY